MRTILVLLGFFGFAGSGVSGEDAGGLRKELELFGPPTGESAKELESLVKALESADFLERAKALKALVARPLLPESVLGLAETHGDLEVRYQLKKLRDDEARSIRAGEMLEDVLGRVEKSGAKGMADAVLAALPAAGKANLLPLAGRALLATVGEGDRERLLAAMGEAEMPDEVKRAVVPALVRVGGDGVEDALVGALGSKDTRLKATAAVELAKMGRKEALGAFGDLLESDDLMVRWHAVAALRDVTGQHFGYGPGGDPERRAEAVKKWRDWIGKVGPGAELGKLGELPEGVDLLAKGFGAWFVHEGALGFGALPGPGAGDEGGAKEIDPSDAGWKLEGGILKIAEGGRGVSELRTKELFRDYVLRVEFQFEEGSFGDSGIGVCCGEEGAAARSYLEVQVLPGKTGDLYRIGGFEAKAEGAALGFSMRKKKESNEKPPGAWNRMELRVGDGKLEVRINGEIQNNAEGLPGEPGRIVLRNEGHPVWFRNLVVVPLE